MPTLTLKTALVNGLRDKEEAHRNIEFLTDSYNCRHMPFGAGVFNGIVQPLVKVVTHPFPQMFVGKRKLLMVGENTISHLSRTYVESAYSIDTLASVIGFSADDYANLGGGLSTGGGVWHFAEIGDNFILCNGAGVLIQSTDHLGALNRSAGFLKVQGSNTVYPLTCCELNGRFILGGLANLRSAAYDTAMNTTSGITNFNSAGLTDRAIYWSSSSGVDALWWFFTALMTDGGEIVSRVLERNEHGFATVPWQDAVWIVKPLGEGFMAYGEHGMSYFRQNGLGFDQIDVASFGVYDRGSVGGDRNEHLILSTEGALYKITPNLELSRASTFDSAKLDYREIFDGFVTAGTDVTISYAAQMKEYYIANSDTCYVLTESGLSECSQVITSVGQHLGNDIGFFEPNSDAEMRVMSDVFDMDSRSVKTIRSIHLGANDPDDFQVRIHHRYLASASFDSTAYVTCKGTGSCSVRASGTEFMVEVKATTGSGKSIENIYVNWDRKRRVLA